MMGGGDESSESAEFLPLEHFSEECVPIYAT